MLRISIAIPCYASGRYLPEALSSLRAQTRRADEIVVADDGSTDAATVALLGSLERGAGVRVLRLAHRGPGPTRNAAVLATTGDLVLPLDADDQLAPRALEKLEAALLAEPVADFAFSHVAYFGAVRGRAVAPRFNPYLMVHDNKLVVTALFRRAVFAERGPRYAEALSGFEDWSFWLSAVENGLHGACVEEPLFRYRRKGKEGQLARDAARRQELIGELRAHHPALYTAAALARLKEAHAPGLELVSSTDLTALVMNQSLDDLVLRALPADARALLREARGKFMIFVSPEAAEQLPRARAALLEQLVRCLEQHPDCEALAVPLDAPTLQRFAGQPWLSPFDPARLLSHPSDLLLIRTARASGLAAAHLPEGAPPRALFEALLRRGRGLFLAEDFFGMAGDAQGGASVLVPASPRESLVRRAWKTGRRAAERLAGEERVGRLLHPLKERVAELSLRAGALRASLEAGRLPRSLSPLLPPSQRMERLLLDAEPVRFMRRTPPS